MLRFIVNDEQVIAAMERAETGVQRFLTVLAEDVARNVQHEAGARSKRLGEPWFINAAGFSSREIAAPEFFAGFLARGTRDHGPAKAPRMIFEIDGETISADFVRGIPADPFDERAVLRTQSRADELLRLAIGA